ncbi:MAG: VTT domain-containing protein [Lachnospiraceae bacterium]|nr:VTT domain-containing protein [Lachnospiraceae bacterium]
MVKNIKVWVLVIIAVVVVVFAKEFFEQKFTCVADVQNYMKGFGIGAPFVLTAFQAFQVVVPVLPGYLGCAAGAVAFGSTTGFLCNYIGISLGSILAYILARKYGMEIVLAMFPREQYDKWRVRIEKSKAYDVFLFVAMLLPLFPDDFLCYFSGLIKMNWKKFVWIIILGKPWCILGYSIVFGLIQ